MENVIKPAIIEFLAERGLELSLEKTKITHINEGFDFLGFNIRKYRGKLLIKPAKKCVTAFLGKIRQLIKSQKTATTAKLIGQLNPKINGWARYYRHVVSKEIFGYVDDCIYRCLSQWTRRRHPNKNFAWIRKNYFRQAGLRNWIFSGVHEKDGTKGVIDLAKAAKIPIKRHVKIKENANPYDLEFIEYLVNRKQDRNNKLYHYWQVCALKLFGNKLWIEA